MEKEEKALKKPIKINFHIHSTGSDGRSTPEEMVLAAINSNLKFICFTDHYPEPVEVDPNQETKNFHSEEYVAEIKRLREKYSDKIDISFGIEFDWLEFNRGWIEKEIKKNKYDLVLGSVHYMAHNNQFRSLFFGKDGIEKFLDFIKGIGGIQSFVKNYYQQIRKMAQSGLFDCVAHFDLVAMNNKDSILFPEDSDWYKQEVLESLEDIKKSKMAIEINTRGFKRNIARQFPSLWILKEAKKRDIPITLGTDSHLAEELDFKLDEAIELAKEAGYDEIVRFKARKRISIPI